MIYPLNIFNPQPLTGGLKISELALRFILVKKHNLILAAEELPPGVVQEGKLKDRETFIKALTKLHSKITPRAKQKIFTIVNIPETNIYTQVFNLPAVAAANLEEAAKLNLQMISPIDFKTAYSDWQQVGENPLNGGQLEILGAFVSAQIVDEFISCLKVANFVVGAIEFSALALSRLIQFSGQNLIDKEPSILLHLDSSGLSFNLIRNNHLYFNHFVSWPIIGERQISFKAFQDLIIKEIQKVLNYALSRFSVPVHKLLLVAPALEEKIS
jgi:Tfp pilus assembly PilM family ATPase